MSSYDMEEEIWRLPAVVAVTGLAKSSIRNREIAGDFPQRVKLTARTVGWRKSEVLAWVRARVAKRTAG